MKRGWKPGDVAISSYGRVLRCLFDDGEGGWTFIDGSGHAGNEPPDLRPLVVIDPEDREQVERLADLNERHTPDGLVSPTDSTNAMQAALREFADPTPPRPEEPTGLGAVVEDADGSLWFRMALENQTWPGEVWQERYNDADRWSQWQDIAAVRVLSKGVAS